ncbi:MAG: LacI family DNA-binding transcriptional regulator [Butyrivibrio sp.]
MVSIKDISAACGVSVSTVSKALNDHKDVSKAKKEMIRRVAKEMGYSPNSSARALKTNRSYNIGVLFADKSQSGLTHDFFSSVLDSFKVMAESKGYDITFIVSGRSRINNKMSYLEHSRFRGFDGVLIACINFDEPDVLELMQSEIPVVTIDYTNNNTITILSNNIKGMQDLTQYAIDMGHTKIAYLYGEDSSVTRNRLSGFYITLEKNGIRVPDEYVQQIKYRNTEEAERSTYRLLDLKEPPTCIFYPDDVACFGGMNAIRGRGLRIPEDISTAGFDGITIARHIEPELTTVVQNTKEIGSRAAEKLIDMIEKPKTTVLGQIVIDGELYPGKTIKKIN